MNFTKYIELIETNWPVVTGGILLILTIMLLSAITAYRACKRKYTVLLEDAEARVTLAEEHVTMTTDRARTAEEQLSIIRQKLESMEPDVFDSSLENIITHIRDVEYSRFDHIISKLNNLKVGEPQTQDVSDVTSNVEEPTPNAQDVIIAPEPETLEIDVSEDNIVETDSSYIEAIDSYGITEAVKQNMPSA